MCVCASGVIGYGLYSLRATLVPFVLAIALTYLLQPLIDVLSVRPLPCCCGIVLCPRPPEQLRTVRPRLRPLAQCVLQLKLPRWLAVCVALLFAFAILALLGFIVADSIHIFTQRADVYSERVQQLATKGIARMDRMRNELASQTGFTTAGAFPSSGAPVAVSNQTAEEEQAREEMDRLAKLAGKIPVTDLIMHSLSSMMEVLSNLALVLLFAVYLLFGSSGPKAGGHANSMASQANTQINVYIRGKVAMSLFVGVCTAIALGALQVDLWLVFGLLAFWLNFIPNVGTVVAVALPMPLVILDPAFEDRPVGIALALLLPLSAHGFAGSVVEPVLFGQTLNLHPVTILLSLMLWTTVWGITGMVMAVPITAVLRVRLSFIQHPLPQYIASLLVGEMSAESTAAEEEEPDGGDGGAVSATPRTGMGGIVSRGMRAAVDPEEGRTRLLAQPSATPTMTPLGAVPDLEPAVPPTHTQAAVDAPSHHHAL